MPRKITSTDAPAGLRKEPRRLIFGYPALIAWLGGAPTRQALWAAIRGGAFPAPVRFGNNRVAWFEDEVSAHVNALPRVSYGKKRARRSPSAAAEAGAGGAS